MNQTSSHPQQVLVILPSEQDCKELIALEDQGYQFDFFKDNRWKSYEPALGGFDSVSYTEQCMDKIKNNQIHAVFYSDDLPSLIASVVAERFGLPCLSIEAAFKSNHKLYSRISERNPIKFQGFTLNSKDNPKMIKFPCHVKPASLSFSVLQATVHSNTEFQSIIDTMREKAHIWEKPFIELYKKYIDIEKFPLAHSNVFLVEEFVEAISQHAVEGWTDANGKQFVWAVSDNNYWPGSGSSLDNNSIPTSLPSSILDNICEVALDTAKQIGLKNGFWNIELWVMKDGKIKVTEVNGRMIASMTPLYHKVFGKSQYLAALKLACNQPLGQTDIPQLPKRAGGMFAISTSSYGYIHDLIKLEKISQISQMENVIKLSLLYTPDAFISWRQYGGKCCLARAWIVGDSYEEIRSRANEIRTILLNKD